MSTLEVVSFLEQSEQGYHMSCGYGPWFLICEKFIHKLFTYLCHGNKVQKGN